MVASSLGFAAASLALSRHGHRVVEKLLQDFPAACLDGLAGALAMPGVVGALARHRRGSLILEQALQFLSSSQAKGLVDGVVSEAVALAAHPRGNLVVQAALERADPRRRLSLLRRLRPQLAMLAEQRWGAFVCVRALEAEGAGERAALMRRLPVLARGRWSMPVLELLAEESRGRAEAIRLLPRELAETRRGRHVLQLFGHAPSNT